MRHETPEWPPEAEKISENYGGRIGGGGWVEGWMGGWVTGRVGRWLGGCHDRQIITGEEVAHRPEASWRPPRLWAASAAFLGRASWTGTPHGRGSPEGPPRAYRLHWLPGCGGIHLEEGGGLVRHETPERPPEPILRSRRLVVRPGGSILMIFSCREKN